MYGYSPADPVIVEIARNDNFNSSTPGDAYYDNAGITGPLIPGAPTPAFQGWFKVIDAYWATNQSPDDPNTHFEIYPYPTGTDFRVTVGVWRGDDSGPTEFVSGYTGPAEGAVAGGAGAWMPARRAGEIMWISMEAVNPTSTNMAALAFSATPLSRGTVTGEFANSTSISGTLTVSSSAGHATLAVDWGDGSSVTLHTSNSWVPGLGGGQSVDVAHTYADPGYYDIAVTGYDEAGDQFFPANILIAAVTQAPPVPYSTKKIGAFLALCDGRGAGPERLWVVDVEDRVPGLTRSGDPFTKEGSPVVHPRMVTTQYSEIPHQVRVGGQGLAFDAKRGHVINVAWGTGCIVWYDPDWTVVDVLPVQEDLVEFAIDLECIQILDEDTAIVTAADFTPVPYVDNQGNARPATHDCYVIDLRTRTVTRSGNMSFTRNGSDWSRTTGAGRGVDHFDFTPDRKHMLWTSENSNVMIGRVSDFANLGPIVTNGNGATRANVGTFYGIRVLADGSFVVMSDPYGPGSTLLHYQPNGDLIQEIALPATMNGFAIATGPTAETQRYVYCLAYGGQGIARADLVTGTAALWFTWNSEALRDVSGGGACWVPPWWVLSHTLKDQTVRFY